MASVMSRHEDSRGGRGDAPKGVCSWAAVSCSWPVHPDQALAGGSALFIYLSVRPFVYLFIYLPPASSAVSFGCFGGLLLEPEHEESRAGDGEFAAIFVGDDVFPELRHIPF